MIYLDEVSLDDVIGKKVHWKNLREVNILVGPNGCGKSTIFRKMYKKCTEERYKCKMIDGLDFSFNESIDYKFITEIEFIKKSMTSGSMDLILNKESNLLTASEKWLLKLFYTVSTFKSGILFIDLIERSLHISTQENLIDELVKLNNNLQLFIITHSPSIIGNYEKSIVYIDNVFKEKEVH